MNEQETKKVISLTIVLTIIIWTFSVILFDVNVLSISIIRLFSIPVTILTLYWAFYFRWGWKIPLLNKIFGKPNLNGTWIGTYKSEDNDKNEYSGKIVLTIRQSFLFVHLMSLTNKFVSYSYGENLSNSENEGAKKLTYLYSQKRLNSEGENVPQGASELSILGKEKDYVLYGDFWTTRHTKGFLKLKFVSRNCVASYQEAEEKWSDLSQWLTE